MFSFSSFNANCSVGPTLWSSWMKRNGVGIGELRIGAGLEKKPLSHCVVICLWLVSRYGGDGPVPHTGALIHTSRVLRGCACLSGDWREKVLEKLTGYVCTCLRSKVDGASFQYFFFFKYKCWDFRNRCWKTRDFCRDFGIFQNLLPNQAFLFLLKSMHIF